MRIVIVEDHLMFREVLRKICVTELHHEVVGEADDGRKAVKLVAETQPDLVLLDLHLPNLDGFGVVEAIRVIAPGMRILVLSSHCDEYTVYRAERVRVQGFVDKNTNTVASLKHAIKTVANGKVSFSDTFKRVKEARIKDPQSFDKVLTERERTVLALIGEALTDDQIAARLTVARETVEKHRFNVLRKLGLRTTLDVVRYAREHGFTLSVPPSEGEATLP